MTGLVQISMHSIAIFEVPISYCIDRWYYVRLSGSTNSGSRKSGFFFILSMLKRCGYTSSVFDQSIILITLCKIKTKNLDVCICITFYTEIKHEMLKDPSHRACNCDFNCNSHTHFSAWRLQQQP